MSLSRIVDGTAVGTVPYTGLAVPLTGAAGPLPLHGGLGAVPGHPVGGPGAVPGGGTVRAAGTVGVVDEQVVLGTLPH